MNETKVHFGDTDCVFETYSTTLAGVNTFFAKAKDASGIRCLVEDPVFVTAGRHSKDHYPFSAIRGTKGEQEFKTKVAEAVPADFLIESCLRAQAKKN